MKVGGVKIYETGGCIFYIYPPVFYTYRDAFRSLYMKKIVFTFGRFNPPTTGHYLLATRVKEEARKRSADYKIYGSNTKDPKRNPLSATNKFKFMKKILNDRNVVVNKDSNNPYSVLQKLSAEGYSDVTMVVGADRVAEFKNGIKKYIGKKGYENIKNFEVVSAGDRDPDAEGVQGMSASKMRAAAAEGNIDAFRLGIPSHVSSKDVMDLFNAVRRGMGIRGKISESAWFDYNEFTEFVNDMDEQTELNELSLQARRKLSMRMKKTAKKRARVRKLREKRRKTKVQLVAKANKSAIKKVRARMHKGRAWSEVSFMERERISEKLKKKKKAIQRISKRLLPAMNKAEKERLAKVKERMTTKDPVKAIAPTNENIDIMFEEFLQEKPVPRATPNREKQKAQDRGQDPKKVEAARKRGERKSTNPWDHVALVTNQNDKTELVTHDAFDETKHDLVKGSPPGENPKGKVTAGSVPTNDDDFIWTLTAKKLLNYQEGQGKIRKSAADAGIGADHAPKEPEEPQVSPELAAASEKQQISQANLGTAQADQQLADMETQLQQQKDAAEAEAMKNYATPMAALLGVENTKAPPKKTREKDSTFDDWDHKAVHIEAATVAVASGCHTKTSQKSIVDCMKKSGIAEADIKKIAGSKTLLAAGQRL